MRVILDHACRSYALLWHDIAGTSMACPTLSERCSHSRDLFALSSSNALRLIHCPLVSTPVYRRNFYVSRRNFTHLTTDPSAVVRHIVTYVVPECCQ